MTKQAVEDLGRGLLILDPETPSTSNAVIEQQCRQAAQNARINQNNNGHPNNNVHPISLKSQEPVMVQATSAFEGQSTDIGLSLGARLRQAREARGVSTADVAEVLKFKQSDVEALESGNVSGYAPVYALGYLRSYAGFLGEKALGANVAEAVDQFRQEHFDPGKEVYRFPEQQRRRRVIGGSLIIGIIVMALGLYMIWQFTQSAQTIRGDADRAGPDAYQASIMNGVVTR